MNMLFVSSSYFLRNIPVAILNKREIIKLKMQRYKDVKVYLYSFILPDYMTDKYVSEQLDALASHLLFPHLILSIANTTIYNPRLVFNKEEGGIIHIVLCFEHESRQWTIYEFPIMNNQEEFSFEELRRLALAHQVKDNKTVIGIWAKLNGYSKRRKQRDNKVYTVYIKMSNDKINSINNYDWFKIMKEIQRWEIQS